MAYGVDAPFGLQPRQYLNGSLWNGQSSEYQIADSYNANIFTGDPVCQTATGTIAVGHDAQNATLGVFIGCKYYDAKNVLQFSPYWPANTATANAKGAIALVVDDPNVLFDVQSKGAMAIGGHGNAIAVNDLFYNFNYNAGAGGSTYSGQSSYYADNTTEATTATLNLKLIRLTPRPQNDYGVQFNNGLYLINNHLFKGGLGTQGV